MNTQTKFIKLMPKYPYYLANKAINSTTTMCVNNKYTLNIATHVSVADNYIVSKAITEGYASLDNMKKLASYEKRDILYDIASKIEQKKTEMSKILCIEAGKPIKDSIGEVDRCIETFRIAAEESTRINGEYISLDTNPTNKHYSGLTKRFPIGLVSMISPFNFPLNLVAHKVAPAIAAGCPFILKPSSLTPISALILGEILSSTTLPRGAFSILPCDPEDADPLIKDDRINLLSFTGSPAVGWNLKKSSGRKKVILELGGNASCVIDRGVDLRNAVSRVVFGAFYQSGQSCISVQRLFVHSAIYDEFKEMFVERVQSLVMGDPLDESTVIGPIISETDAERCAFWIKEAVDMGSTLLAGKTCKVVTEEIFGPVVSMEKFNDYEKTIELINESKYGLQAGVFTNDFRKAFYAFENLQVGGVVINDVPSKRIDAMPYGGIKNSGIGKEGVRDAIEEMTEKKLMLMLNK